VLTLEENLLLRRVEGDAPMSQWMQRHRTPVSKADDVSEANGTPVKARLFGEDLVVCRDGDRRVGVRSEACAQWRESLTFGRNEKGGMRCLYHGWKFDVEGNVLKMASEAVAVGLVGKTKHTVYRFKKWGGVMWAYLRPRETAPGFARPPWAQAEEACVSIAKAIPRCDWAQILEGATDSAHSSNLPSSDMVPARIGGAKVTDEFWLWPPTDGAPRLQVECTLWRLLRCAAPAFQERDHARLRAHDVVRRTRRRSDSAQRFVRHRQRQRTVRQHFDGVCFITWGHRSRTPGTETWRKFLRQNVGVGRDEQYRPPRIADNHFLHDRRKMRSGDVARIGGSPNQDITMWVTKGPIADHTHERLGTSNLAIVEFRREMLDAVLTFQCAGQVIGGGDVWIPPTVYPFQAILMKTADWRSHQAHYGWEAGEPAPEPSYPVTQR